MKKILYLYSGEGTKSRDSDFKLLKHSKCWSEISAILQSRREIDLEELWKAEIDKHACPYSPLLTVVSQICLADLWTRWGFRPDVVIGHSIGELAAAYQAGLYSLEEILELTYQIGAAASKLEGAMLHGKLTDRQLETLSVHLSSKNFMDGSRTHVTVSGSTQEMERFGATNPEFVRMRLPHPWHHPDYRNHVHSIPSVASKMTDGVKFVSGVTTNFETRLTDDHWRRWLVSPIDFIAAMQAIRNDFNDFELEIVEIGFHPVLESCCEIFDDYQYVSSMFRGEDEIKWIICQRKRLDQDRFSDNLKRCIAEYNPGLDYDTPLAYQGFSSLKFLELSAHIQPFFPSLAPQDFYRYKTLNHLIDMFGVEKQVKYINASRGKSNQVVIAGMSVRFPSAVENLPQFWKMLLSKQDQVTANPVRGDGEAGYLDDRITRFDHQFFGIPKAEARTMDPQQILALELTELLWRDAGLDPAELDRKRVGVYIGVWNQEYLGDKESVYYPTGTNPSLVANRISYHYDLRGPSWVSNTACSSSLVAVHYAAKDIEDGRVDYAVAGGVNMLLGKDFTHRMRSAGFLSKDHRCKAFDDAANGYVRAEGGGMVFLANKSLVAKYYAEILGTAINQNGGRAQLISAPHAEAQEEVILAACQDAAINAGDIAYIECHGTGTKIGDPIEISAIQNTIARNRNGQKCYIGSVKSNIGHLESAAGIAGLIKSALILNYGLIPPNLHFNQPNQYIDFDSYKIEVVQEATAIDPQVNIGISSFGFGGSNAHIIIKGVATDERKAVESLEIPFDRNRAVALSQYYRLSDPADSETADRPSEFDPAEKTTADVIRAMFMNLTGLVEVDPDEALLDQGLDSMSATEFLHNLQQEFNIELDTDVFFDYPRMEQLVGLIDRRIVESRQN
jgi:acyl transferase domain-containing protein/aryl carrier-like protein